MVVIDLREAIGKGLKEALINNDKVFIMGEDVGEYGGAYSVTKGLLKEFGPERIMDTPISESVIVGAGIGSALAGLRPIVEIMTINFSLLAMDQIVNHAAKLRYMSNGQFTVPILIRTVTGGGAQLGATHSQSFEGWYASVPGLKVIVPSTPYDALGLMRSALKEDNPVIMAEHALLYGVRGEVPNKWYEVPIGKAIVRTEGNDVTIIGHLKTAHIASEVAKILSSKGKTAEVIDIRTLRPIDTETIVGSVKKTNRAVVIDEAWKTGGFAAEIASVIQEQAFDYLDGPVIRIGSADVPSPYAQNLEAAMLPNAKEITSTIEKTFGF